MAESASTLDEVELPAGTLVIADLHLELESEASYAPFLDFLGRVSGAPRLVVLGDLFEFWLGAAQGRSPGGRAVLGALRSTVSAGTALDVVPGNRDFLLDRRFEEATGGVVRRAGLVGRAGGGTRVLFVHGDELSTLDRSYQRLRRVLRAGSVRWLAGHLPTALTDAVARRLRRTSRRAVLAKPAETMALQPAACRALAREHRAATVVCGHAHRFRDEVVDESTRWLVLDAFGGERDMLELGPEGELAVRGSRTFPAVPLRD